MNQHANGTISGHLISGFNSNSDDEFEPWSWKLMAQDYTPWETESLHEWKIIWNKMRSDELD